jgi:hypothetical protein
MDTVRQKNKDIYLMFIIEVRDGIPNLKICINYCRIKSLTISQREGSYRTIVSM